MPRQSEGIPIDEIMADDELEAAADLPLDTHCTYCMELQQKVKELEDQKARDHFERNQMVEKMKRDRQLHDEEKISLERRLSTEMVLRQALTVTMGDDRDSIEQLIRHYEDKMREQAHQFDLLFAVVQERLRIHDQQYKDIQETLHARNESYEVLLAQLREALNGRV